MYIFSPISRILVHGWVILVSCSVFESSNPWPYSFVLVLFLILICKASRSITESNSGTRRLGFGIPHESWTLFQLILLYDLFSRGYLELQKVFALITNLSWWDIFFPVQTQECRAVKQHLFLFSVKSCTLWMCVKSPPPFHLLVFVAILLLGFTPIQSLMALL